MKDKILEGNKIIVEFVGWQELRNRHFKGLMDEEMELFDHSDCYFDSDWSWLMPVVIKLINHYGSCFYLSGDGYLRNGVVGASLMDDSKVGSDTVLPVGQELQATWESVVSTLRLIKERK